MENNTIKSIFDKYGSDKSFHGYHNFYAKHLPENPKKILEIGVKEGRSIMSWKEIYPNSEIHGLDLFNEFPVPNIKEAIFHKGNQVDYKILFELRKYNFDLIIDDGSHNSRDQLITFFGLFNGGHYFIEDLHCCDEPFYNQGLPYNFTAKSIFSNISSIMDKNGKIVLIHNNL